ncbi:MAG: quinone-dependent dihydroorotate dehydrogenase [Alphaproteobacteria bacterium]|nr:quinone-dependent dihydroorotate dehydrogenase [Alphaproteobacteria bacterium]
MAGWYSLADPWVRCLDAETAHRLAIAALATGVVPAWPSPDPPSLAVEAFGRRFTNPVGLAAGFDKNAEAPDALLRLGFGFVEVGTVTPRPQAGNPRPRLFRLAEDRSVINRMGFPGEGLERAERRLARRARRGIVGANVGANKDSTDRAADYADCAAALAPHADYLVCNVSSPNTPGLRNLQGRTELGGLIDRVRDALGDRAIPLLVKIAPDVDDAALDDIVEVARARRIDGLIVGNTTLSRPASLRSARKGETGGLSGEALTELACAVLARAARRVERAFPLIGCGGIATGADAYARLRAGATLLQLYSALVFEGPPLVAKIKRELAALLQRDGFPSVSTAVGADL